MEQKIDELIDLIRQTKEYRDFVESSIKLESKEIRELLARLQDKIHQINELKKYGSYTDPGLLEQELKDIRIEVSQNRTIQDYYRDYYALNELLEKLTGIIFKNISPELIHNSLNFRSK